MFSIGVGLTNLDEIYAIASEPNRQNTILVDSFEVLKTVSSRLVAAICEGDQNACLSSRMFLVARQSRLLIDFVVYKYKCLKICFGIKSGFYANKFSMFGN